MLIFNNSTNNNTWQAEDYATKQVFQFQSIVVELKAPTQNCRFALHRKNLRAYKIY